MKKASKIVCLISALFILLLMSNAQAAGPAITDADWVAMNEGGIFGANGPVFALAYYKKRLFVGGYFTAIGNIAARNIAQWDGQQFSALGTGTDSVVNALAVDSSGNLYAGGMFFSAGGVPVQEVAKWDGTRWSALGSGKISYSNSYRGPAISSLSTDKNGNLYAGGMFEIIGGIAAVGVARWNGTQWSALGGGRTHRDVDAVSCDAKGNLFAGGDFDTIGGMYTHGIARWDGIKWDSLQGGIGDGVSGTGAVSALACDNSGNVFAGGRLTGGGDSFCYNILRWNGVKWNGMGTGLLTYINGGEIASLAIDATGKLFAGGHFNYVNGDTTTTDIAQWNGTTWSGLGHGLYDPYYYLYIGGNIFMKGVFALAADEMGNVFSGGLFKTANGIKANNIARWDGNAWSIVGSGITGPVRSQVSALVSDHKGNLYAGGDFERGVVRWGGGRWDTLGPGVRGKVTTLCIDSSGNVFAGGQFDSAGGHKAKNVAKWDGTRWVALDLGLSPGPVRTLACDKKGNLFAAGAITTAGRIAVHSVAWWNGNEWDSLGAGIAGNGQGPFALVFDTSGNLFAGGEFTTAGSTLVGGFAKWDGNAWASTDMWKGTYTSDIITALVFDKNDNLYFSIGRGYANYRTTVLKSEIMMWNKISLQSIGRMNGNVPSLAVDVHDNMYLTGNFDTITSTTGSVPIQGSAKWNGSAWETLGSGTWREGKALAIEDSTLYAGGGFFMAGNKWSPYIAKVNIHNIASSVRPYFCSSQIVPGYFLEHCTLRLVGIEKRDNISLYSLSGELLRDATGVSTIKTGSLSTQLIIICIKRGERVISTGIIRVGR
jgi:hypothetical protein